MGPASVRAAVLPRVRPRPRRPVRTHRTGEAEDSSQRASLHAPGRPRPDLRAVRREAAGRPQDRGVELSFHVPVLVNGFVNLWRFGGAEPERGLGAASAGTMCRAADIGDVQHGSERPSDEELWRLAVHGSHDAWGDLFVRHRTAIYNYCFRRVGVWGAAEDLASAVFLEAWRRRSDVRLYGDSALLGCTASPRCSPAIVTGHCAGSGTPCGESHRPMMNLIRRMSLPHGSMRSGGLRSSARSSGGCRSRDATCWS
jgi:hypothetical protein